MQNYGDLLFPLVAARRLSALGVEVVPIAPTKAHAGVPDALSPLDIAEMLSGDLRVDGIVIGGGYLIHTHRMDILREYQGTNVGEWAGAGLWLGAALAAALRDVPLAWNAPGVPHPIPQSQRALVDAALRSSSYVSVRDRGGAELLAAPEGLPVEIVPDPIAELGRLWTTRDLEEPFQSFLARKGFQGRTNFVAVHFRNRSLAGQTPQEAAAMLSAFAKEMELTPILSAIGRAHDDDVLARAISLHLPIPHILLDDPASLREVAAAIAFSRFYVGASLHGYITAAAYGVPGILVARPAYRKFAGFLEHIDRMEDLARDWATAYGAGAARKGEALACRIPQRTFDALDRHWRRIEDAIATPEQFSEARRRFLSAIFAFGLRELGPQWAMQPVVRRAADFAAIRK
ncbi:MAG: polysaccharide pyruvyl transferase family protein [Methylocystis sp.]|uniref:polysaccharide pyruvyl transferase family protein n=1 Tax=Methylocystis sp. TaxID=1911079 RepID=UPI00393B6B36